MTKNEILKRIAELTKALKGKGKSSVTGKDEHGYGWGGQYRYAYKFDRKAVTLAELNTLVKKNCKSAWTDGMNRNGYYPIRKAASANGGTARMKVNGHTVEAISK